MDNILDRYPEYGSTSHLDTMRHTEYGYLDEQNHVYLDYTGAGLAARAQHRAHAQRQAALVLGNPHSVSPTSELATDLVEQTRTRVLQHLHASPDEYAVIFTANATGAARLVGEAYPFRKGRRLVLTADNHNSLNGLREYARRGGAPTAYVPCTAPELTVDPTTLLETLGPRRWKTQATKGPWQRFWNGVFCGGLFGADEDTYTEKADGVHAGTEAGTSEQDHEHDRGLFAYPAQSNFSGVRHPLWWVAAAQARGYDVLLDAAAYLPTATLDLSAVHPDFVLVSWYKLFGYPTGVGCLVARRAALARLSRPWFAGGTIRAVSVGLDWHAPAHRLEAQFEDGTVNFQSIPDVCTGLDWLQDHVGFPALQTRVRCLTGWFLDRLLALRHSNGQPMVVLYGPAAAGSGGGGGGNSSPERGGTVTFNFVDPEGALVDERLVAAAAAAARISLRTGCFCNPGAGETALGFTHAELRVLQRLAANSKPSSRTHSHDSRSGSSSTTTVSVIEEITNEKGAEVTATQNVETQAETETETETEKKGVGSNVTITTSSASSFVSGKGHSETKKAVPASPPSPSSSETTVAATASASSTSIATTEGEEWPIAGAVRVSFGVASNTADVDRFFAFAETAFRDRRTNNRNLGPRVEC
ncbi:molybdenum cofactor sulfurase [Niveomyces insectorum RCEF 264]|uniref:Molybdenum cofactor sulfurase n=1 Tax=Niveomyces insectorum RCEF 264 TaxID=1081102 RepID=A0A167Y3W2_9HYPO|nr:molybdenum cofactor sulfurase [Niveomyces insectorum RCEF 264]